LFIAQGYCSAAVLLGAAGFDHSGDRVRVDVMLLSD
jgi:hypothetical protein